MAALALIFSLALVGLGSTMPEDDPQPLVRYEMYFDQTDIELSAQVMWGEAGCSWISDEERMAVLWAICNRVDKNGGTIKDAITCPNQFTGWKETNPVDDHYVELAISVLVRWSLEKQGLEQERELPSDYLWFAANKDMTHNVFRNAYSGSCNRITFNSEGEKNEY